MLARRVCAAVQADPGPDITERLTRELPAVVEELVGLTRSRDPRVRLAACREILDRVLGRPTQSIDHKAAPALESFLAALREDSVVEMGEAVFDAEVEND